MDLTDLVHPEPVTSRATSRRPHDSNRFRRFLHSPLLHFVVIGGLLYVASSQGRETPRSIVSVNPEDITQIVDQWRRNTGRAPDREELDRLIDQFVDDSLLIQVARELGWDRDDTVVRRRLIQNLRFLDAAPEKSDEELLDEAYALGMQNSDIVVRRRLLERVRLVIADRARSRLPTDEELQRHLDQNPDDFLRPARVRLTQVYLSRDRRGQALHDDAVELVATLTRERLDPTRDLDAVVRLGDPFLLQPELPMWSMRKLSERLGPGFAEGAMDLPIGRWSGPIVSSYGEHAVWVHERADEALPPLAEIRDKVTTEVHRKWETEALARVLRELREQATIEVASLEPFLEVD